MSQSSYMETFDSISSQCLKPKIYIKIYLTYVVLYIIRNIIITKFPNDYVWGELLIGYQGGFIRRGLLGQILWWLEPYFNIRFFTAFLLAFCYFCLIFLAYKKCFQAFGKLMTMFLFIWPPYFLFLVKNASVFFRRDLIIDLLILIAILIIIKGLKEKVSLIITFMAFSILFSLSVLLYEASIFYWPLPAVLLGLLFWRNKQAFLWLGLMLFLFSSALFYSLHFQGSTEAREAICAAWQSRLPKFKCLGGMEFVGQSLTQNSSSALNKHSSALAERQADPVARNSLIAGIALGVLPLIILGSAWPLFSLCNNAFHGRRTIFLIPAFLCPWIMPVIATDYGRHISMACLEYLFFFMAMQIICPQKPKLWLTKIEEKIIAYPKWRIAFILGLLLIGSSWNLLHWTELGQPYLVLSGFPSMVKTFFFIP